MKISKKMTDKMKIKIKEEEVDLKHQV